LITMISFINVSFIAFAQETATGTEETGTEEAEIKARAESVEAAKLYTELDSFFTNEENCFPRDLIVGKYIYTITEEPLIPELGLTEDEFKAQVDSNSKFFKTTCFRNTLSYKMKIGSDTNPKLKSELLRNCSEGLLEYQKNNQYSNKISLIFTCQQVQVFFSKGGTSLIEGYIKIIYTFAASLVGLIAVAVIIISGMQVSLSTGDSTAIDSAKGRIIKSLAGLAILFLSGLILYTINPNFFTDGPKEIPQTQEQQQTEPLTTPWKNEKNNIHKTSITNNNINKPF